MAKTLEVRLVRCGICPECGKGEFHVQHILDELTSPEATQIVGPWYCKECGVGVVLTVSRASVDYEIWQGNRRYKQYSLVEIPPLDKPIRLVVENSRFSLDINADLESFHLTENTATLNLLNWAVECSDIVDVDYVRTSDDRGELLVELQQLDKFA